MVKLVEAVTQKLLGSLTSRIFLGNALLALLSIACAIYFVNARLTAQTEAELQRNLQQAVKLVRLRQATQSRFFELAARLTAEAPHLKAAVSDLDPATAESFTEKLQPQISAAVVIITDRYGRVLARAGNRTVEPDAAAVKRALTNRTTTSFSPSPAGLLELITVPIWLEAPAVKVLGTLCVGFALNDALAEEFKGIFQGEVAFAMNGRIVAATLPRTMYDALEAFLQGQDLTHARIRNEEYQVAVSALDEGVEPTPGLAAPSVVILYSETERLKFLTRIHSVLLTTTLLAVSLAILMSYAVARTIMRPLRAIMDSMREMSATGDLARKIALPNRGYWDDQDARLLGATLNILTDSLERFRREHARRERLSALGRMSTVIAHEIRNPLMILRASVRPLKQPQALSGAEVREIADDIDGEITRINRIVTDVLDFARPISFELAAADINLICVNAVAASQSLKITYPIHLTLGQDLPPLVTDAERLRMALINLLNNARHAVDARFESEHAVALSRGAGGSLAKLTVEPWVELSTEATGGHVLIVIRDRGIGIDEADLARVFDPYFTTKPGGTGLGLAIVKNIVEGLGGTIKVVSRPKQGTDVRIELTTSPGFASASPPLAMSGTEH